MVSVITRVHSNPARVPLEIVIRIKSKGEILDEMIFDYSISSIWRINQTEFFVLLGSENLLKIKIVNQKLVKIEESKIHPFDKPTFGTNITSNLFFKLGNVILYYDSYNRSSFRLLLKTSILTKEVLVGMKYPGLLDRQQFIYPPHRTVMIKNNEIYILDEVRSIVYIIDNNLASFKELKLQQGYEYQWDLLNFNLSLIRRDKDQNLSKIALPIYN